MSYQLYVTGGYGFTERILPSLLHPSEAVSIAQDYFSRGYQGAHIEPAPDAGFRVLEKASSSERQGILDALQSGQMVLARQDSVPFGLFTKHSASPDHLRSDLPKPLVSRLREQWPTGTGGGLAMGSDSLHAPAQQDYQLASEPVAAPIPGKGSYKLTIQYRWPDGTGVADLPFQVGTDLDGVSGTLDHQGAASVDGLNGRYATVRLGSNASDDTVRHERKAIIAGLDRLLEEEQRETEYRAQEYQVLPWYQKAVVSAGAFSEGAFDAADATVDFVNGMYSLNNPAALALDVLKSSWGASQGNADSGWGKTFIEAWNETRHERWVQAIGFSPSDISPKDMAEAYELASLVMFDDELRTALGEFLFEYAVIHHHTEYAYVAGALVFEVVLSAILGPAVFGGGKAAQASGSARYAGVLAALGASFRKFGEALKLQQLRKVWRDADLKNENHFEAEAKPRPKGVEADPAAHGLTGRPKKALPQSLGEAKGILKDARAAIIASGKAPPPKYTQAQLHQIASEGFGDEKYIVRLVEESHRDRNGPHNGTLGKEGPAGVQIWSTSFDQIAHLDTDPKLISEAMGVNYKPDAKYKLAIVDQVDAVKYADAETIVPTYSNLTKFVQDKLPGKVENPALVKDVMTPEYSREYEGMIRGMPANAWTDVGDRELYLSQMGLDSPAVERFETRFSIQDNTGANEHFTGNGLTKTTNSTTEQPVYGTVEAFSLHKNPKTFRQMMGMEVGVQWVDLVDLEPINFGA